MNSPIDRFPVADLPARYDIKRTALYERLNALLIKPQRLGNKAYVSGEQLERLDELNTHLQRGGGIADFVQESREPFAEQHEQPGQLTLTEPQLAQLAFVEAIASRLAEGITLRMAPATPDPFAYLRVLEEAGEKGWVLTTSELGTLLNLAPSTIRRYGNSFSDSGFAFARTGKKRGEISWTVTKEKRK